MGRKLIPGKDIEFIERAQSFANTISQDPARFSLTPQEAQAMAETAAEFRAAYQANWRNAQSRMGTLNKNLARDKTKALYTRLMNKIRRDESVSAEARVTVGLKDRPARLHKQQVPPESPRLDFVRALHQSGAPPMHELRFKATGACSTAKPAGAVRIELFVDLIPPNEPIPARPGANHGGRPWYLRSYTRSPIRLAPPMASVQMRVVYWARWADSTGNVGPFSATAVALLEGGSHHALPGGWNAPAALPDAANARAQLRDETYSVAVMETQQRSLGSTVVDAPALPEPERYEARRLEGPPASEAA